MAVEDRLEAGKARPLLLAAAGRKPSDTEVVRKHGAPHRDVAGSDGVETDNWEAVRGCRLRFSGPNGLWRGTRTLNKAGSDGAVGVYNYPVGKAKRKSRLKPVA